MMNPKSMSYNIYEIIFILFSKKHRNNNSNHSKQMNKEKQNKTLYRSKTFLKKKKQIENRSKALMTWEVQWKDNIHIPQGHKHCHHAWSKLKTMLVLKEKDETILWRTHQGLLNVHMIQFVHIKDQKDLVCHMFFPLRLSENKDRS